MSGLDDDKFGLSIENAFKIHLFDASLGWGEIG